eukprot:1180429-Prorocentrum_minimum.AAC.2
MVPTSDMAAPYMIARPPVASAPERVRISQGVKNIGARECRVATRLWARDPDPLWTPSGPPLDPLWTLSGPPLNPLWTPSGPPLGVSLRFERRRWQTDGRPPG